MPELSVSPRFKQDLFSLFCILFFKLILKNLTCSDLYLWPLLSTPVGTFPQLLCYKTTAPLHPVCQTTRSLIPRASINAVLSKLLACLCYAAVSGALGRHSPFIWVFFSHKRLPRFTALDTSCTIH